MRENTLKKTMVGELLFPDESYAIMGAAFEVYKELGPGFLEGVYESAFARELGKRDIPFRRQVRFGVLYKGEPLDKHYICDLVVYGKIIIELKAIRTISDIKVAQALNYLKVTGLSLALILNFSAHDKLEWKRVALSRA